MVKIAKTILKVLISFSVIYFIYSNIDLNIFMDNLKNISIVNYLIALLVFNLSQIVSAKRLEIVLYTKEVFIPFTNQIKLYYLGMFYNLFLPMGIAGDGYKIYLFKKQFGVKTKSLIKLFLYDRLSGLFALVLLMLLNIWFFNIDWFMYLCGVIFFIFPFFLLQKIFFRELNPILLKIVLFSLIVQGLQALSAYFLFTDVTSEINIYLLLFFISSIATVLPLTIGGIGARELVFVIGLGALGLGYEMGVLFCALFFSITFISSAIGVFYINKFKS